MPQYLTTNIWTPNYSWSCDTLWPITVLVPEASANHGPMLFPRLFSFSGTKGFKVPRSATAILSSNLMTHSACTQLFHEFFINVFAQTDE